MHYSLLFIVFETTPGGFILKVDTVLYLMRKKKKKKAKQLFQQLQRYIKANQEEGLQTACPLERKRVQDLYVLTDFSVKPHAALHGNQEMLGGCFRGDFPLQFVVQDD